MLAHSPFFLFQPEGSRSHSSANRSNFQNYSSNRGSGARSAKTAANVEEAFLRTTRKIHECIAAGAYDLNSEAHGIKVQAIYLVWFGGIRGVSGVFMCF